MSDISWRISEIGGGKSYDAVVRDVCWELAHGERWIVTDLPLMLYPHKAGDPCKKEGQIPKKMKLWPAWWGPPERGEFFWQFDEAKSTWRCMCIVPGLIDWCHNECSRPVDLNKRLRLLQKHELKTFWRHLPGFDLEMIPDETRLNVRGGKDTMVANLDDPRRHQNGCLFVKDEVHLDFPAREWQNTGYDCERYMSQLRKLDDDLVLITQDHGKVDKNFRRNATEIVFLTNQSTRPGWLGVTRPGRFRRAVFKDWPERKGEKPIMVQTNYLYEGVYRWLYDTTAGSGLAGRGVTETHRKVGRSPAVWVLAVCAVGVASFVLPVVIMRGAGKMASGMVGSFTKGFQAGAGTNGTVTNPLGFQFPSASKTPALPSVAAPAGFDLSRPVVVTNSVPLSDLYSTGFSIFPGGVIVTMSDGSTLDQTQVRQITKKSVLLFDGTEYPIKAKNYEKSAGGVGGAGAGGAGGSIFGDAQNSSSPPKYSLKRSTAEVAQAVADRQAQQNQQVVTVIGKHTPAWAGSPVSGFQKSQPFGSTPFESSYDKAQ